MTTQSPVLLEREGAVAHLILNRPEQLNAIDEAMAVAFHGACEALHNDPFVRVVVLRGAGRCFGAGGDLSAFREHPLVAAKAIIEPMHQGLRLLAAM